MSMDIKNEDLMSFKTPEKTFNAVQNNTSMNESFHEVKDVNAFFQSAKIFDIDNRESLMLLKNLDEVDLTRKSLGISKEFFGIARESIGFKRESLDFGRESLGILQMSIVDDPFSSSNAYSPNVTSILNRAVLYSQGRTELSSSSFQTKTPLKSFNNTCVSDDVFEDDKKSNDFIFMEARVLATSIRSNSIFEENDQVCHLESTVQPDWLIQNYEEKNPVEENQIEKNKIEELKDTNLNDNKESELLTSVDNKNKTETECDKINLSTNLEISPITTKSIETQENTSKICQNRLSTSRISSSTNVSSKNTKEILENLSEFFSSENPTNEQKSEAQSLLHILGDILVNSRGSSKRESSDDSGHSSIETEQDVNNKNCTPKEKIKEKLERTHDSENEEKALDLSLNSSKKQLQRSMSLPGPSNKQEVVPKVLKSSRVSVPGIFKGFNTKLKPKKIEEKKKGPMKATLPLGNMAKVFNKQNKISCTPPRSDGLTFGKKVVTPKHNSNLRPVAQSTPTEMATNQSKVQSYTSQLPKPRFSSPVSPLARPNNGRESSSKIQRTLTDSTLNKSKPSPLNTLTMNRRKSSSDIQGESHSVRLQRSNSISKDVKPNLASCSGIEKKRIKNSLVKPFNVTPKFGKSAGKENRPQ